MPTTFSMPCNPLIINDPVFQTVEDESTVGIKNLAYGSIRFRRLKSLEEDNRRLKLLVADQALDNRLLREVNAKKW